MAWSSKNLHPKNDPRLRPGHSKPFPQLQTTASRFAYSNFGEDAGGTHGRGSLLHRAGVGRHGQIHDGQRLSPFRVLPRGPANGLREHRIRASRVKPTELDAELGRPQRPSNLKTSEFLPAEVESIRVMTQPERPMVAIYVRNSAGRCVQCNRSPARRRRTERYASQRCVEPACHTSTASWLNWCQCWSRDRRRVASSCGCVSAGINCGANVRRTSATGEEVEGTPDVIARLVAFKFSFA